MTEFWKTLVHGNRFRVRCCCHRVEAHGLTVDGSRERRLTWDTSEVSSSIGCGSIGIDWWRRCHDEKCVVRGNVWVVYLEVG
jgi:hypothetical protein